MDWNSLIASLSEVTVIRHDHYDEKTGQVFGPVFESGQAWCVKVRYQVLG